MKREQAKAILPIIRALADGKTIQRQNIAKYIYTGEWADVDRIATDELYYPELFRVKPKPRKFAVELDDKNIAYSCWEIFDETLPNTTRFPAKNGKNTIIKVIEVIEDEK